MVVLIRCGCSGLHAENMQGLKNFLIFARFASAQLWKMISLRALAILFVLEKINCIYVFRSIQNDM